MPLFERSLKTEFWLTGLAAFGGLSAIVLTIAIVRLLGIAALGNLLETGVFPLVAFNYMRMLPVLLSLALFLAIYIALTRQIQDHEAVIWSTSGLAPNTWFKPIFRFALPITLAIAAISLVVQPWLAAKRASFEAQEGQQRQSLFLSPGSFTESAAENRIVFVEGVDEKGTEARRVFIADSQANEWGVTLAETGYVTEKDGDRRLHLQDGTRYEYAAGEAQYRILNFARFWTLLEAAPTSQRNASIQQLDSLSLLQNPQPAHLSELYWRIGFPVSAFVLAFMALPLSRFNPRNGRSLNILFAILIYAVYNNLITFTESLIGSSRIGFGWGIVSVHGTALAIFSVLYVWRMNPLRRPWRG